MAGIKIILWVSLLFCFAIIYNICEKFATLTTQLPKDRRFPYYGKTFFEL